MARHIILATAEGCGTAEIMRRSGKSKPVVWRWQAQFMAEGVDGLTRDKTRKPGKQPLPATVVQRVVDLTLGRHRAMQPLDRSDAGESGWREPAFGATHPRSAPTGAASRSHLQAVDRPKFAAKLKDIVGLYVDPPPCGRSVGR